LSQIKESVNKRNAIYAQQKLGTAYSREISPYSVLAQNSGGAEIGQRCVAAPVSTARARKRTVRGAAAPFRLVLP